MSGPEGKLSIPPDAADDMTVFAFPPGADGEALVGGQNPRPDDVPATVEPAWAGQDELPQLLSQRYRVEERIGRGGLGAVYRARDLADGRRLVAVKVLHDELLDKPAAAACLLEEGSKLAALNHPAIVRLLATGREGRRTYLVLEYVAGQSLRTLLHRHDGRGLPGRVARPLLQTVGTALAHAHGRGIRHGDLKPSNILVGPGDQVKLIDFVAESLVVEDGAATAAVTPTYCSPQRLAGEAVTVADDVLSFAVIAYETLSGRHPYDRLPSDTWPSSGITPRRPPGVSPSAWRLLCAALSPRRQDRPTDVLRLVLALRRPSFLCGWLDLWKAIEQDYFISGFSRRRP